MPQLSEKDCASGPQGITIGPDGALWFTDSADKIGRITTRGKVPEFAISTLAHPMGITTGPDGALWFTESKLDKIGRITTQGRITEFALPSSLVCFIGAICLLKKGSFLQLLPAAPDTREREECRSCLLRCLWMPLPNRGA